MYENSEKTKSISMEKLELFKIIFKFRTRQNVIITAMLQIACRRNRGYNAIIMPEFLLNKSIGHN